MTDRLEDMKDNDPAPKPQYVLEGKAAKFLLQNGVDNTSDHYSVIELAKQHGFVVEIQITPGDTASDVPAQQEL
jgi:hypothetical protein